MSATERKPGFYWVRDQFGVWEIAEWDVYERWTMCGSELPLSDKDFEKIGPRISIPDTLDVSD